LVTLDEEIYKDIQHLMKFWSWHSTAIKKELSHVKFRPAFNETVKANPKKYWQYAIRSTIYYLKKAKMRQTGELKSKRQRQTIELSELYKLKEFNTWIRDNYSENLHQEYQIFNVDVGEPYPIKYELKNLEDIAKKIFKLECKLAPKQMVVAFTKAEKEANLLIEDLKKRTGWTNWIASSISSSVTGLSGLIGYGSSKQAEAGQPQEIDSRGYQKSNMNNSQEEID